MFQEKYEKLREQLVEAQELQAAAERNHQRVADLMRSEADRADKAEKLLAESREEVTRLTHQVVDLSNKCSEIPRLEIAAVDSQEKARVASEKLELILADNARETASVAELQSQIDRLNHDYADAVYKIKHMEGLVVLLHERLALDRKIENEIDRMG